MLAAHATVAIENARLFERSRELSVVEERNRLARDLHDSVTQTLFSVVQRGGGVTILSKTARRRGRSSERVRLPRAGRTPGDALTDL
jgi:signal transduction histidine kinase